MSDSFPEPWPAYEVARIADAVEALAARVAERDVAAQLHGLASVLRNLDGAARGARPGGPEQAALSEALAAEDEPGVVAALRALAGTNRAALVPVDWSAASGG